MTPLFGLVFAILATVLCWAAVTVTRAARGWLDARALRRRGDGDTVEIVRRRPLVDLAGHVVLVLMLAVPAAVLAGGGALPGPAGGAFAGGTVPKPVVLTGDNASGTGTLRIRPSDEDTQIVLCDASNNSAPEMCSAYYHMNPTATTSLGGFVSNGYFDTSSVLQRYWTSAGQGRVYTAAGSSAANNAVGLQVFGTAGAAAGNAALTASGAATSDFVIGSSGTVTVDIRGPVQNGGSATCGGVNAGDLCINEGATTNGRATALLLGTVTNCSDGAGAAACSAAPAGGVVMDAAATTVVVSTTAVTANSRIFIQEDPSLVLTGSPTCNTTAGRDYTVTARTAATSFTITASAAPITDPACLSYFIVN